MPAQPPPRRRLPLIVAAPGTAVAGISIWLMLAREPGRTAGAAPPDAPRRERAAAPDAGPPSHPDVASPPAASPIVPKRPPKKTGKGSAGDVYDTRN